MYMESEDTPNCAVRGDIATVDVFSNFVHRFLGRSRGSIMCVHFDHCPIVAFVYVLVDVLDRSDPGSDLNIDMTVVSSSQCWIIRHDMPVVSCALNPVHHFNEGLFRHITSTVERMSLYVHEGLFPKRSRKPLLAYLGIRLEALAVLGARSM